MMTWLVYEQHIKIEGEELVAVVIAPSEVEVRNMLKAEDAGFDPQYGRPDWLNEATARCKCIGVANPDEKKRIVFFQSIRHHLVYGPREELKDRLYAKMMGVTPPQKRFK